MIRDPFDIAKARRIRKGPGELCVAGQHAACAAVGDPYEDVFPVRDELGRLVVWVCDCPCHW